MQVVVSRNNLQNADCIDDGITPPYQVTSAQFYITRITPWEVSCEKMYQCSLKKLSQVK